jgi:hypothetical protein
MTRCPTSLLSNCLTVPLPHCHISSQCHFLTVVLSHVLLPDCTTSSLPYHAAYCPNASLSHRLILPPPHRPTVSLSHCLDVSSQCLASPCLTVPLSHCSTSSQSHYFTFPLLFAPLSNCLTALLAPCHTASLPHYPIVPLSHWANGPQGTFLIMSLKGLSGDI